MPRPKFFETCKRAWLVPQKAVSSLQFLWRHGPISRREAERVDRLCRPAKYLGRESENEEFERKRNLIGIKHSFSWMLLIGGAVLIILGLKTTRFFTDTLIDLPAGAILAGVAFIVAGLAVLLRKRSI
jgi:hypothetical protein